MQPDDIITVHREEAPPIPPAGLELEFHSATTDWTRFKVKQVILCDDPQMLKAAIEVKHENGPVMQPRPQDADHPLVATNHQARKNTPIFSGVLRYFPRALAAVAALSQIGNEQHNPGTPLHWDRSKSGDEWDALTRHLLEVGTFDTDGVRHAAKVAWRALAGLEKELEDADRNTHADAELGPGC